MIKLFEEDEHQTRICGLNKNIPVNVMHALPAINPLATRRALLRITIIS